MGDVSEAKEVFTELKRQILERVDLSRDVSDEEMQELIDEVVISYGKEQAVSLNERRTVSCTPQDGCSSGAAGGAGCDGDHGKWHERDLSGEGWNAQPMGEEFLLRRTDTGRDPADHQRMQPGGQ